MGLLILGASLNVVSKPYRRPLSFKTISEKVFQTAYDITPEWHLKIQAAFQQFTDNAVSKTVNLPSRASVEEIEQVFLTAMQMPVKGVTASRDESCDEQVLAACSIKRKECS